MARQIPPLNQLRAFEAAARCASFRRAGDELGVGSIAELINCSALWSRKLEVQMHSPQNRERNAKRDNIEDTFHRSPPTSGEAQPKPGTLGSHCFQSVIELYLSIEV